jgi:uncharacterized protein (TIGR02391 family)
MAISQVIPNLDVFLALQPEELGAKLLFLMRAQVSDDGIFSRVDYENDLLENPLQGFNRYSKDHREAVPLALHEAWAWLEAQGLIVTAPGQGTSQRVLSRRARRFQSETEFANYAVARMLPREALNAKLAEKVWMAFMRGEFDVAAFQAMKAVEVAVRDASGLPDNLLGVKLMRDAFRDNGPLADMTAEAGERVGRMEFFAGAIGSYKNPHSHRDVDMNDPAEALEIILLANHLLRIVDARRKSRAGQL